MAAHTQVVLLLCGIEGVWTAAIPQPTFHPVSDQIVEIKRVPLAAVISRTRVVCIGCGGEQLTMLHVHSPAAADQQGHARCNG